MKEPWTNYVRLGLVHFMAFPQCQRGDGPIVETIEQILYDDFFEAIEIGWMQDAAARARVRDLLASSGITAAYGAHPRLLTQKLDLNSLDADARRCAVEQARQGVDEARELGCGGFAFLSGKMPASDQVPAAVRALVESCYEICEYAAPLPVHLETFDYDVDKCCLVGPTTLACEVALRVRRRCPNFGLLLDLSHLPIQHENPAAAVAAAGELLTWVHVGNACLKDKNDAAYGDQHPRFGYPGGCHGADELAEFLAALFKSGYLGPGKRPVLSFEVKPQPGETSEAVIANCKRTWQAAWAKL